MFFSLYWISFLKHLLRENEVFSSFLFIMVVVVVVVDGNTTEFFFSFFTSTEKKHIQHTYENTNSRMNAQNSLWIHIDTICVHKCNRFFEINEMWIKKKSDNERRYCLRFGLSFYAKQCIWQESSKRSPKRIEWQPNDKGMKAILQSNKQEISYCHIWRSLRKLCLCALQ